MNPGQFNKRIKFLQETTTQNQYLGAETVLTPVTNVSSGGSDNSVTFGSLEPIRQYHQFAIEAGASVLNQDIILKIRKRAGFEPTKSMVFQNVSDPDNENPDTYTILTILPYWPGAKAAFQNNQESVYHDEYFLYIIGVKRN